MEIEIKSMDEMIKDLIESFDKKDSYYPSLDEKTWVYEAGTITLLTGRTSQAKTCLTLNLIIEQLINNPESVCLYLACDGIGSTERNWLVSITASKLNINREEAIDTLSQWISTHRLILLPNENKSVYRKLKEITSTIEHYKLRYGITHFFIDDMKSIESGSDIEDLDTETKRVMSELKTLIRKLELPLILVCPGNDYLLEDETAMLNLQSQINPETYLDDLLYCFSLYMYSRIILGVELLKTREQKSCNMLIHILKDNNRPSGTSVNLKFTGELALVSEY